MLCALTTAPALIWSIDLDILMRATSACLAAVLVVGVAAAARLLPPGLPRRMAAAATVFCAAALACCELYLLVPAVIAVVAVLCSGRQLGEAGAQRRRAARGEVPEQPQPGQAPVRINVQPDVADLR